MRSLVTALHKRRDAVTANGERGITLVELLVAMLLLSIVLVLIGSMYATMQKTVGFAGAANNNLKRASLGMTEMSRVVRFAAPNPVVGKPIGDSAFVLADKETLTVYSYIDTNAAAPQPTKVTFSLDSARRLIEARYSSYALSTGYWGFNTTPYRTRILTGTVIAPTGTEASLFSYQDFKGDPIVVPAGGLTPTSTPDVRGIAAVKIRMKIKGESGSSNPLVLENTVGMPNLGLNRTGQ